MGEPTAAPLNGLRRTTVLAVRLATQMLAPSNAMPRAPVPAANVPVSAPVSTLMRDTLLDPLLAVHTLVPS